MIESSCKWPEVRVDRHEWAYRGNCINYCKCIVRVQYLKHGISLESRENLKWKCYLCPFLALAKQIKMRMLSCKNSEELLHPGNVAKWMKRGTKAGEKCGEGKSTRFSDSRMLVGGGGRQKRRVIENWLSACR